jgi:hypothetical protein
LLKPVSTLGDGPLRQKKILEYQVPFAGRKRSATGKASYFTGSEIWSGFGAPSIRGIPSNTQVYDATCLVPIGEPAVGTFFFRFIV